MENSNRGLLFAVEGHSLEQVRSSSGHPEVHFGTIVEGSWGEGGGGMHGRSPGLPDYQGKGSEGQSGNTMLVPGRQELYIKCVATKRHCGITDTTSRMKTDMLIISTCR